MINLPSVILKPGEEKRVLDGHPWIYFNEIAGETGAEDGDLCEVKSSARKLIGLGYFNSKSKITVRMLDILKQPSGPVYDSYATTRELLEAKIKAAVEKRSKITNSDSKRLVFSESDSLPGLIADLYKDTLVVQITTLGMEKMKDEAVEILSTVTKAENIYEKSLSPARQKEGLELCERVIKGEPEKIVINENGLKFNVDPLKGSKTGFYLDQRDNRMKLEKYVKGKKVLDAFCFSGGFTAYALHYGAETVLGIDSAEEAVEAARANMKLNKLKGSKFKCADVFEEMKAMTSEEEKFDLIILDPPPFSKSHREKAGAMRGYRMLHNSALKLLEPGGILFTFSCSQNVSMSELITTAKEAARRLKCRVEMKEQMFQAKDHPYNTSIPETFYLKGAVLRKV